MAKKSKNTSRRHSAAPRTKAARPGAAKTETAVSPVIGAETAPAAVTIAATTDVPPTMFHTQTSTLIAALRDPSAETAGEAAAALGANGDRSAVEPLKTVLVNADGYYQPVVRAAAAASLGQLGDPKAVPALIAGIRDEMAEASAESVRALAAIGDRAAVSPIMDVVVNSDGYYLSFVRRAAVLALAKLGGPEATSLLRTVAEDYDEDPVLRQAAMDALA